MASNRLNLKQILYKSKLRSKIPRENFDDVENFVNDLQNQIDSLLVATPSGTEVTNARDYFDVLRDRLRGGFKAIENTVIYGGEVVPLPTAAMYVRVKAVIALVNGIGVTRGFGTWTRSGAVITITESAHGLSNGNKIYIDVSSDVVALPLQEYIISNVTTDTFDINTVAAGATSGSCEFSRYSGVITAPTAGNYRYDIVTVNSDNTISITSGSDDTDPVFPAIVSSQRPLAYLSLTDATATITSSEIININQQGCIISDYENTSRWYFDPQDAIDAIDDDTGGHVLVRPGHYYREFDLTDKNNLSIEFQGGSVIYRPNDTERCLYVNNGSLKHNIRLSGNVFLNDNGKAGSVELAYFYQLSNLHLDGLYLDDNSASSATYKEIEINVCSNSKINVFPDDEFAVGVVNSSNVKSDLIHFDEFNTLGGGTFNDVFDALAPSIPETNDEIFMNGTINTITFPSLNGKIYTLTHAIRTSPIQITFHGHSLTYTGGSISSQATDDTFTITDGDATNIVINISWIKGIYKRI